MISLLKDIDNIDIILASESPRRFELLKMIGLEFKVRPSHVDEVYQDHLTPEEYAIENAKKKGQFVANKYPNSLIISADTIVVYKNDILEKPEDELHAIEILKKLSNHTHEVITGFGFILKNAQKYFFDYEKTKVTFRKLTDYEIKAYIETGEPFDKAGGYGAQGFGSLIIQKVEGCFFNVVGLPLSKFFTSLDNFLQEL